MATVLMGWEIGAGFGHVRPLLTIGRALASRGHRPVFALRNVVESRPLFEDDPFPIVQAPIWHDRARRGKRPFRAGSYADILAVRGWDAVETLVPQVEAWQQLLDLVQPRLVVGDHSPTLCLAAYRRLPVVLIGSWFYLPPVDGPTFPLLVTGQPPLAPQEQLLAAVQEVQRGRKRPIPESLPGILAAAHCFPIVLAEIDPYRSLRKEPTWDPFDPLPSPGPLGPGTGFFAYLNADNAAVEPVLTHMARTGIRGTAYLRGAPAEFKQRLRQQGLTVLDNPAVLVDILKQVAVIVHHGGVGTTQTALASGRPQILLPLHLEQSITGQMLVHLGVGAGLSATTPETAGQLLQQVVAERRYTERAQAVARGIQARPLRDPLPVLLERCLCHLSNENWEGIQGGG